MRLTGVILLFSAFLGLTACDHNNGGSAPVASPVGTWELTGVTSPSQSKGQVFKVQKPTPNSTQDQKDGYLQMDISKTEFTIEMFQNKNVVRMPFTYKQSGNKMVFQNTDETEGYQIVANDGTTMTLQNLNGSSDPKDLQFIMKKIDKSQLLSQMYPDKKSSEEQSVHVVVTNGKSGSDEVDFTHDITLKKSEISDKRRVSCTFPDGSSDELLIVYRNTEQQNPQKDLFKVILSKLDDGFVPALKDLEGTGALSYGTKAEVTVLKDKKNYKLAKNQTCSIVLEKHPDSLDFKINCSDDPITSSLSAVGSCFFKP